MDKNGIVIHLQISTVQALIISALLDIKSTVKPSSYESDHSKPYHLLLVIIVQSLFSVLVRLSIIATIPSANFYAHLFQWRDD